MVKTDHLRTFLTQGSLSKKAGRFITLMGEFELTFVNQKSVKGQIIVDWLADNQLDRGDLVDLDFPDECVYYIETRPAISEFPWYTDIINYIMDNTYPDAVTLQQR
ncbi:hypothetical protein KI387_025480, partial [Taxus chinensis]